MNQDYYFSEQQLAEIYAQSEAIVLRTRVYVARGYDEARVPAFAVRYGVDDETIAAFTPEGPEAYLNR